MVLIWRSRSGLGPTNMAPIKIRGLARHSALKQFLDLFFFLFLRSLTLLSYRTESIEKNRVSDFFYRDSVLV